MTELHFMVEKELFRATVLPRFLNFGQTTLSTETLYLPLVAYECGSTLSKDMAVMSHSLNLAILSKTEMAEMFRLMVDEIEETAIFLMNPEGIITVWNGAAESMKGYSAAEAVGQFYGILYPPEAREQNAPHHNLMLAAEHGYFREETWRMRKDGSLFWARIALTALRDDTGALVGFSKLTIDMTAHKRLEECVAEKEANQRIMEAASAGTWSWNPVLGNVKVSPHLARLLGYADEVLQLSRDEWLGLIHPDEMETLAEKLYLDDGLVRSLPVVAEIRVRALPGDYRWVYMRAQWRRDDDTGQTVLDGVCVAIQELKKAEHDRELLFARLQAEEERAQITLGSITDGVITTDSCGAVTRLNPAAQRLTGWTSEDALGRQASEVFHVSVPDNGEAACPIELCLRENRVVAAPRNTVLISRHGKHYSVHYSCAPLHILDERRAEGAVLIIHDVTEAKGLLDDLSYQASHDSLTGLLNRREFGLRLQRTLDRAKGEPHNGAALLYMDLDQFKIVNDTCGHSAGDDLLQQLAIEYRVHVRERDTLARLGGDEFALIVEHCSIEEAHIVATKMLTTTRDFRYTCAGKAFQIGVSIGLIPIHSGTVNVEEALRLADHACYIAKEAGRNRIFVQKSGDIDVERRRNDMHWASKLGDAFNNGQLQLFCQPIRRVGKGPAGLHYEILLRLQEQDSRPIEPGMFLPAAERYDLMPHVDRWVLSKTVAWLEAHADHVGELELCSLNISQRALADDSFRDFAVGLLGSMTVPCHKLCFEITETGAFANLHNTLAFIDKLKQLGCRFALDDFGTGMASFAYLKQIPVDFVKIDGSFISMMTRSRIDFEMVRFTNEISHVMGRQTIAEYVSDSATLHELENIGVDFAQGFLLGEPRPLGLSFA
jgi:diguanylate cyclase (GGDEF)-like protein/PAS domain S-box-containing protein